ncbi:MAG TPA: alanine racemase [Gaiellaceae bacterium]|nr:alanine racemase [Gaiellaceae bacterium]
MHRSEITIDLGALRRNVRRLRALLRGAELWAVVKADGYGHGAVDVAGTVLDEGATVLGVATMAEALELRGAFADARILVMGPTVGRELAQAREARIEVTAIDGEVPEGLRVHLKLDTGMGRWGGSEARELPVEVVGLMTHLATADSDSAFAREQVARFVDATQPYSHLTRHAANSAATLALPESHLDAVRCGIALYGLSPFGHDPAQDGLEPVLRWESRLAQVKQLAAGESTGYGRRFTASEPTWIGIVPIGYADGFRRDMTGTEVLVEGERRRVLGTISMDALAVELPDRLPVGTAVTLIGDGALAEEHAAIADTINYEIVCGINSRPGRARRTVIDA